MRYSWIFHYFYFPSEIIVLLTLRILGRYFDLGGFISYSWADLYLILAGEIAICKHDCVDGMILQFMLPQCDILYADNLHSCQYLSS